jgi:hypothetical protein
MQRIFCVLTFLSLCFAVGCGGSVVVKGTVKTADGTPIESGTIIFLGDKEQFSADIQPGGTFSPGKFADGDGITPGVYRIYLTGVGRTESRSDSGSPTSVPVLQGAQKSAAGALIHSKYALPETSELTIDTSKSRTLNLVLDPAQ